MSSTVLTALIGHKHGVDQHPVVTAVLEKPRAPKKPRAPILIVMSDFALAFAATFKFALDGAMIFYGKLQQFFSCLRAVQFCTRLTGSHAASWGHGHFCDTLPRL